MEPRINFPVSADSRLPKWQTPRTEHSVRVPIAASGATTGSR